MKPIGVCKFSVPFNKNTLLSNLVKKHSVTLFGYPISHKSYIFYMRLITAGYIIGNQSSINSFLSELKKSSRFLNGEFNDNFVILDIRQHIANRHLFQPGVIHVKPSIITSNEDYIFELAAWEKNKLQKIIKAYRFLNVKLHWIKQKKITTIQTLNIYPNLSAKQRDCFNLAVKEGYYSYPRKITLTKLTKMKNISYSTFQHHLRHAENK